MKSSDKPAITWFFAARMILSGKSKKIGKYPGLKSILLWFALLGPFAILLVQGGNITKLSGNIPPEVATIRATGKFIQMTHGQSSWVAFVTSDGHTYNMERGTSIKGAENMPQEIPPSIVYAEGFLRQNGDGYFWPTLIKTSNGNFLVTPRESISLLMRERSRNLVLLVGELSLCLVFFIISIFSISKVKNNLTSGEQK